MSVARKLVFTGVGGQGVLTAARILGDAALALGHPVRVGQLHGLSQRGGSVETTVILGPGRTSFIGRGQADVVVGFEPLETLRVLARMTRRTRVLLNRTPVVPVSLAVQGRPYPDVEGMLATIRERAGGVVAVDGTRLAQEAGDARSLNAVMLGVLAGLDLLPLGAEALATALGRHGPASVRTTNLAAFRRGRESVVAAASGGSP